MKKSPTNLALAKGQKKPDGSSTCGSWSPNKAQRAWLQAFRKKATCFPPARKRT